MKRANTNKVKKVKIKEPEKKKETGWSLST